MSNPRLALLCLYSCFAALGCRSGAALDEAPSSSGASGHSSPYVAQLDSPVRGLSAQEVDDLLNGRGMGFARAAELSGYPGPRHVLDLADELELEPAQRERAQMLFDRMQREAKALGAEIVERERALGQSFVDGTATEASVRAATAEIATLQGELRAVHLRAHLELTAELDPGRIAKYAELRGYAGAPREHQHGHH